MLAYCVKGDIALDFQAQLKHVSTARASAAMFIGASVQDTRVFELLAGPTSVFTGGGFVTMTSLGVSSPAVTPP